MNYYKYAELVTLTRAKFDAAQAALAQLRTEEQQLIDTIETLSRQQAERAKLRAINIDSAAVSGVDLRWEIWAEDRKKQLNQQLAQLRLVMEQNLARVRKSFAENEAARELAEYVRAQSRQTS